MNFDRIMIRYGEMALKGKNKRAFEQKLQRNLISKLKDFRVTRIEKTQGRMYVLLNGADPQEVMQACQQVFGIHSLSFAVKVEKDEEQLKEAVLLAFQDAENASTFKISSKRTDKTFPIPSQELNPLLGGHILRNTEGVTVDVRDPDVDIKVEVRHEGAYITAQVYPGAGGLPVGTTGKSLLMLSGGIDSPVSGYLTMKRGVAIDAIHFHSPPYTSDRAKQKVIELAQELSKFGTNIKIHVIPFTAIQQKIQREMPQGYSMTIMRRMMMRISERVAEQNNILSITTGESLGQVASQTMESMSAINEVTNYPVIRPLVAMDKLEIIDIARKIGTYDISIRPFEDCCTVFVPKAPKTKPNRQKANYYESNVDFTEDIEKALTESYVIDTAQYKHEELEEFDELF
ncbi:UNVERIFIED_CONTAM: tRNA 4-thiouridine(8) synthase ThiI [Halobacillus marinus]|uniref:tRNA uracil 4-sulfurtransferase ThiI n=1 Tax=Bacillaceae TaxID=186817 RepID=UPI0002A5223D|nr:MULTISPECIES: tRNA uracil 4-sulfurtransferase ThiI [Bacillaceae]ELK47313.1 thiamine biosynthesis protein ThiI [Halobacillus sp. BAB-2008]QHT47426.1 tRNA 4-thiouridine(8) synthase ThiI [Bacillus sp. SB49]